MNTQERLGLLRQARQFLVVEAENVPLLAKVFLPLPSHRLALGRDVVVVRGERGSGKSALFRLLSELNSPQQVRAFLGPDIPEAVWLDAFSQHGTLHPEVGELDRFSQTASDGALRAFWMLHLLQRVAVGMPEVARDGGVQPDGVAPLVDPESRVGAAVQRLDAVEAALAKSDQTVYAAYDHLDRIGQLDRRVRERCVSALLALWLSLSNRYRHLRAKVFLREDVFEAAESAFADAGKLRPRSVAIEWDVSSLYQVVVRYMAANPTLRTWVQEVPGLALHPWGEFGDRSPEMTGALQRAFAERLAGRLMGKGENKGYTYRWVPNHLQDGRRRIVPRSILNLVGYACEEAQRRPLSRGPRLVTAQDLWSALKATSQARVRELAEEYPLVHRLENLRGRHVLMDRGDVIALLGQPARSGEAAVPGETVFDELVRLGVLIVRDDRYGRGRVDVPDLYRYGHGILRKGGVKQPT